VFDKTDPSLSILPGIKFRVSERPAMNRIAWVNDLQVQPVMGQNVRPVYNSGLICLFFRSGTILLFLFLMGQPLQKKPKAPSFQIRPGRNLAGMFIT